VFPSVKRKKTSLAAGLDSFVGAMWLQLLIALLGLAHISGGLFIVVPLYPRSEFPDTSANLTGDLAQAARTKDE